MRNVAGPSDPRAIAPGVHACCLLRSDDHRTGVLHRLVAGATGRHERVAVLAAARDRDLLADVAGSDRELAELRGSRQLEVAEIDGETVDGLEVGARLEAIAQRALTDGFSGLRAYVDLGWVRPEVEDEWVRLELELSRLVTAYPVAVVCGVPSPPATAPRTGLVAALHADRLSDSEPRAAFGLAARASGALAVTGELDAFCVPDFKTLLDAARAGPWRVLDLSQLRFVDLAGAAALHQGVVGSFRVESPPPILERIWGFLGLDQALAS